LAKVVFFYATKEKDKSGTSAWNTKTKVHVIFWLFQKWAFCFDACTWGSLVQQ